MCGIFLLLNNFYNSNIVTQNSAIHNAFMNGKSRGPEVSTLVNFRMNAIAGFHRLAINGLNEESNQPLEIDSISLICNGEIYNYKELYEMMDDVKPSTDSDCEVIIHLYKKFGIEYTLSVLDGVFAFALQDCRDVDFSIYLARDPYGVRPLYELKTYNPNSHEKPYKNSFSFASEMKMLIELKNNMFNGVTSTISQFKPGTYSKLSFPQTVCGEWKYEIKEQRYNILPFTNNIQMSDELITNMLQNVKMCLKNAVKKRVNNTDRPIACLLSGGLDSSLITALVSEYYDSEKNGPLKTFSIGLPGSEDIKYAKKVADFLKTDHTSIEMSEKEFFDAIPEVIYAVETYDTTTVRASVGNYLVSKYISKHCDAKVIFNGDGADEVMGGYLYFHKCPNQLDFDRECRRLVSNIHTFDVQRSDRSISSNGLEPRTPFLDRGFVQAYFSLPAKVRYFPGNEGQREKYIIRKMFDDDNLLPKEILWRVKEAFSDGVSSQKNSWYSIIGKNLETVSKIIDIPHKFNTPNTKEEKYYRKIFESHFPGCSSVIPYFWMPSYVDATDSSARTLDVYNENMSTTN